MSREDLGAYSHMVQEMFSSAGQAIGNQVMLLVVEHALWKVRYTHEEALLIHASEEGVSLERLSELDPDQARAVAHDLVVAIIATLGRLVGKQLANQLVEELEVVREGERLG